MCRNYSFYYPVTPCNVLEHVQWHRGINHPKEHHVEMQAMLKEIYPNELLWIAWYRYILGLQLQKFISLCFRNFSIPTIMVHPLTPNRKETRSFFEKCLFHMMLVYFVWWLHSLIWKSKWNNGKSDGSCQYCCFLLQPHRARTFRGV